MVEINSPVDELRPFPAIPTGSWWRCRIRPGDFALVEIAPEERREATSLACADVPCVTRGARGFQFIDAYERRSFNLLWLRGVSINE